MPIKSDELCAKCYYDADNPGCNGICCDYCDVSKLGHCLCLGLSNGDPCPYFKPYPEEHTEEPDYDEILRTLF